MAGFEAPSFSLGLDLDISPERDSPSRECALRDAAKEPSRFEALHKFEEDEDLLFQCMDSEMLLASDEPTPDKKRLNRGENATPAWAPERKPNAHFCDFDDEINVFKSQEDPREDMLIASNEPEPVMKRLKRGGNAMPASAPERKPIAHFCDLDDEIDVFKSQEDTPEDEICSAQNNSMRSNTTFPFSPIRRFQLLDSDSDDSFDSEEDFTNVDDHSKKGFIPMANVSVPTPILDEVCEEYFQNLTGQRKDVPQKLQNTFVTNNISQPELSVRKKVEQNPELCNDLSPAHQYFFSEDPRIQKLVRSRLSNFFPLEFPNQNGKSQIDAASIDYTKQFNHEENSKGKGVREQIKYGAASKRKADARSKKASKANIVRCSRKAEKESQKISEAKTCGGWVNPKSHADNPTNAGSRRVHAENFTVSGWHTASNGSKVYVTKNGEQLTGRAAYIHYQKERGGAGFRKFKSNGFAGGSKKM